ncbi:MAG: hypothetical protein JWO70_2792, partial [Betaproteobacteria bacterium]|nr:hypothetical protein [Betaproteobacteria bacterium]
MSGGMTAGEGEELAVTHGARGFINGHILGIFRRHHKTLPGAVLRSFVTRRPPHLV